MQYLLCKNVVSQNTEMKSISVVQHLHIIKITLKSKITMYENKQKN